MNKSMNMPPRHIGLLLAAGWSKRFNGDKRLAGATPLLMQTYAAMKEHFDLIVVVHRYQDDMIKALFTYKDVVLVAASDTDIALGTSISAGAQYIQRNHSGSCESVSVCLADMPNIKSHSYQAIVSVANRDHIIRPYIQGNHGHPVCFGSSYLNPLCCLIGENGASSLIKQNVKNLITLNVDDWGVCFDIDTIEDLQIWQGNSFVD